MRGADPARAPLPVDWADLFRALALVLVIEGLMPFAAPARWRAALQVVAQVDDRTLRFVGLGSMLIGLVVLRLLAGAQ